MNAGVCLSFSVNRITLNVVSEFSSNFWEGRLGKKQPIRFQGIRFQEFFLLCLFVMCEIVLLYFDSLGIT